MITSDEETGVSGLCFFVGGGQVEYGDPMVNIAGWGVVDKLVGLSVREAGLLGLTIYTAELLVRISIWCVSVWKRSGEQ